jgi:tetratricopeptide (TPR) repeat protein
MTSSTGEPTGDPTPEGCDLAETLIAARAAGALGPDTAPVLDAHLASCAACLRVAREIDAAPGSLTGAELAGFEELSVVAADTYIRGIEIGRGGMGHIIRAYDRRLGRVVAIKQLLDARLAARFEHEARLTARLQHPAIVTIYEAGRWPGGEPFYAMKYVAGRPLDAVIAGLDTLDERLALLANLTTVVEAVAYAHSERIVHRDLKPGNILVGAFGETVVIDWGLAKDLRAARRRDPPVRAAGGAFTHGGAGTPAYMAPEQARGEPPDERVDVYALGATLHHLLAGDRPDRRPLPAATPPDLRAIVARAMADAPDDRYPTAAELATELRRFQNGQLVASHRYTAGELARRWLRRHRGIALVASCALAVVAAGGALGVNRVVAERDRANREREVAEAQRRAAEAQRKGAERLVEFMLGTLYDRLEPIGKLDLLAGVGQQVVGYFAALPAAGDAAEPDPAVLGQRARGLGQLGDIDLKKGRFADASVEFEGMRRLCERWQRLSPTRESAACIAAALCQLASIESYRGDSAAALARWRQETAVLDAALAIDPGDLGLRRLRGELHYFLAREWNKQGNYDRARQAFRQALAIDGDLVAQHPADVKSLSQLAAAHDNLCILETEDGHPDMALIHCQHAVEAHDQLRRHQPDTFAWEVGRASAMVRVADAALAMGNARLARTTIAPAVVVLRRRAASDPSNALWQSHVGSALWTQCTSELETGHPGAGERACVEAAATFEDLLRAEPEREAAAINLVGIDATLAIAYARRRELVAARAAAARAVEVAEGWNRKRHSVDWQICVNEAQHAAATVARADGRLAEARAAATSALAAAEAAAPPAPTLQGDEALARAELLLADLEAEAGDRRAAEPRLRSMLSRLEAASHRWPHMVELQERLAFSAVRLAELVPDPVEARALGAQALRIVDPLVQHATLELEFRGLPGRARRAAAR